MAKLNFKTMNIDDIINWCKQNNEVDWLKREAAKTINVERYTRRVKKVDENGNVVLSKNKKPIWIADKTSPKVTVKQPITFVQIKYAFCEAFMPDIIPAAEKKAPTMYDLIKNL
jgi:beta-lactamase class D